MANSPALDRVMGQAEDAAARYEEPASTSTALTRVDGRAVAAHTSASAPSLQGIQDSGGISVDQYLQLKYEGFKVNEPAGLFDADMRVKIDLAEIVPISQIRSTRNGQTEFYKSYNGVSTPNGESFDGILHRLSNLNGTVITGPYQTAEIPFTLLDDVTVPGKTGGTLAAGTRLGTTPPITGVKFFSAFLKELSRRGISTDTGVVEVKLKHNPQQNSKGNQWGTIVYELIGEVDGDE